MTNRNSIGAVPGEQVGGHVSNLAGQLREPHRTRVAASLWSVPTADHLSTLQRLGESGLEVAHWDLTDGEFAKAGGFSADRARGLSAQVGVRAEAHLMVTRPMDHVDAWTDFCELVVVHAEANDWQDALQRIEARGARPALALSPGTPTSAVTSIELAVLIMSITPGQAGAQFDRSALTTVAELANTGTKTHGATATASTTAGARLIGLDGGVTASLGHEAVTAGANWLISGTDLCGSTVPRTWFASVGA